MKQVHVVFKFDYVTHLAKIDLTILWSGIIKSMSLKYLKKSFHFRDFLLIIFICLRNIESATFWKRIRSWKEFSPIFYQNKRHCDCDKKTNYYNQEYRDQEWRPMLVGCSWFSCCHHCCWRVDNAYLFLINSIWRDVIRYTEKI